MTHCAAIVAAVVMALATPALLASPANAAADPDPVAPAVQQPTPDIIICPTYTPTPPSTVVPIRCCPPLYDTAGSLLPCFPYPCNIRIKPYLCCRWIMTADTTDPVAIPIRRCWPPCPHPGPAPTMPPADDLIIRCQLPR